MKKTCGSSSVMMLFAIFCLGIGMASAHVVLVDPVPRTNNDYLFSFEPGVCNPDDNDGQGACDAFCGDPYLDPTSYPLTTLPVGVPLMIRWQTTVAHAPYEFRISLNQQGDGDNHFDAPENILATVSDAEAASPDNPTERIGNFSTSVIIPVEALEHCSYLESPCVMQLWDIDYFVSCANVVLEASQEPLLLLPESSNNTTESAVNSTTTVVDVQSDSPTSESNITADLNVLVNSTTTFEIPSDNPVSETNNTTDQDLDTTASLVQGLSDGSLPHINITNSTGVSSTTSSPSEMDDKDEVVVEEIDPVEWVDVEKAGKVEAEYFERTFVMQNHQPSSASSRTAELGLCCIIVLGFILADFLPVSGG